MSQRHQILVDEQGDVNGQSGPIARIVPWVQHLRAWGQRRRRPLLVSALAVFVSGTWLSFNRLAIEPSALDPWPLVAQLMLTPLSLLYAGVGMHLLVRSAGATMPVGKATTVAAYASLAEALPLPGGAIVRAGALMAGGTGFRRSSALVLVTAVLWISLAALGCGVVLIAHDMPAATLLALAGTAGCGATIAWLTHYAGWQIAAQTLLHRVSGMALIAVRLHLAFLTLGIVVPLANTLPFALANIAGSAASIAPAGLGISELLAAGIARTVAVAPAAAFLAVALDRLICLSASGIFVLFTLRARMT